tara:strand:- start:3429 stop:3695 length:267 start_codon:yes stop_codon:yes gene_type:complete
MAESKQWVSDEELEQVKDKLYNVQSAFFLDYDTYARAAIALAEPRIRRAALLEAANKMGSFDGHGEGAEAIRWLRNMADTQEVSDGIL